MSAPIAPRALRTTVLLTGATVMAVELGAARLFAPHFGTAMPVWANLIGAVLLFLAIGSWLGGRLAGHVAGERRAVTALTTAGAGGLLAAAVPTLAAPALALGTRGVAGWQPGLVLGSFAAALLTLALPTVLLATVVPLATAQRAGNDGSDGPDDPDDPSPGRRAGRAAGELLALSTAGSIGGVFLAALVALPLLGTRRTFAWVGAALALSSAAGLWSAARRRAVAFALLALIALALGWRVPNAAPGRARAGLLAATESAYHYVEVVEAGETRYLLLDEGAALQSAYTPGQPLTGGLWDDLAVAPLLAPGHGPADVRRALVIGLAGGSVPRALAHIWSPAAIDGVELDPAVVELARAHMALDEIPALAVHVGDGRTFLEQADESYDLIVLDAYRGPYPPFHLTTRELFAAANARLTSGGVLAVNAVSGGGPETSTALADALARTLGTVFPSVLSVERTDAYNRLLVAGSAPPAPAAVSARRAALPSDPAIRSAANRLAAGWAPADPPPDAPLLTDDRAPVEWLVDRMLVRAVIGADSIE